MKSIAILGLVVAIIPFLGIPGSWKTVLFFVIGLTIFTKAFLILKKNKIFYIESSSETSFKQNNPDEVKESLDEKEESF